MNVVMANMWKRRRRRWGTEIAIINKNILRRNLGLHAFFQYESRYAKAMSIVQPFLMENYQVENIRLAVRKFYDDIGLI
jgi:hypothetical protein